MQNMELRKRPLGVTIIAILQILQGIFEVLIGIIAIIAAFVVGHALISHGHTVTGHIVDVVGSILGGFSLLLGLLNLIFAFGLWTLKRWAFWLTIIIQVVILIRHLFEFLQPHSSVFSIVIGMIIPIIVLIYFLVDSNVRKAFRI